MPVLPTTPVCDTADERDTASVTCPPGQTVTAVGFASFGTPAGTCGGFAAGTCNAATSRSVVEAACLNKASCQIPVSNNTFGDPCPFTSKSLAMQVTCGVPSGIVCSGVPEGQSSSLACPAGQVVKAVGFASFGTPTGTCGAFAAGACNAATSKSVIEAACLGKTQCQVPATNARFGDPCPGNFKGLQVQVTCGAP